ncbi:hypothetical protein IW261DRAFT_1348443 [Armillaria novae-zelandiae]|uniref:Uncharacterized protein n=1 Tax=Armillaria novae-zelandiae TaxID=153914 RepID=A0AA39NAS1_9AGAR|nr:hypothetical protein IW261DRAFT_1348443 [Armillaria novae-zelandiae]
MVHSLRSLGSSAMNFAMFAQGGLDMYWYVVLSSTRLPFLYVLRISISSHR